MKSSANKQPANVRGERETDLSEYFIPYDFLFTHPLTQMVLTMAYLTTLLFTHTLTQVIVTGASYPLDLPTR